MALNIKELNGKGNKYYSIDYFKTRFIMVPIAVLYIAKSLYSANTCIIRYSINAG